jgi:hypothetical protein
MTSKYAIIVMCLASCNLGPLADDPIDSGIPPKEDAPPPPEDGKVPFQFILPPGTVVPSTATDNAILVQIRINDGVVDPNVTTGVHPPIPRGTGKVAGNVNVRFWNFGPTPIEGIGGVFPIAVVAPLFVFGTFDDAGVVFTPSTTHPQLIDSIPGDVRYSPIRRVVNVPFTPLYAGELITSVDALNEAIERGLVGDPVNDVMIDPVTPTTKSNTFINLPVVLPTATLEVGPLATDVITPRQVYGGGFLVDVFEIGTKFGRQPFRNNFVPIGQVSGLQTGVPAADGSLPTAIDPKLVFQYPIPTAAPLANAPNYSPVATDITVRLASGVAPTAILADNACPADSVCAGGAGFPGADLFKRAANGAITGAINGFFPARVSTFTVQLTTNNIQLQFEEGLP